MILLMLRLSSLEPTSRSRGLALSFSLVSVCRSEWFCLVCFCFFFFCLSLVELGFVFASSVRPESPDVSFLGLRLACECSSKVTAPPLAFFLVVLRFSSLLWFFEFGAESFTGRWSSLCDFFLAPSGAGDEVLPLLAAAVES